MAHIRETDAIVHIVRCFQNSEVIFVRGVTGPIDDIGDRAGAHFGRPADGSNVRSKIERQAKGNKRLQTVVATLDRVITYLDEEKVVRSMGLSPKEQEQLQPYSFLTVKQVLHAANVHEDEFDSAHVQAVRKHAEGEGNRVVLICAKLEAEISELALKRK